MKQIGKQEEEAGQKEAPEAIEETFTPFTSEDLIRYWGEYAQEIEENAYLKGIIVNSKPALLDNDEFEISVYNPGQSEELLNNSAGIIHFLRTHLKNSRIQMKIRLNETNEKKLAYTSTEKYEHLLEINPALAKLKDEFNLTAD